jgi:hypothetical protein
MGCGRQSHQWHPRLAKKRETESATVVRNRFRRAIIRRYVRGAKTWCHNSKRKPRKPAKCFERTTNDLIRYPGQAISFHCFLEQDIRHWLFQNPKGPPAQVDARRVWFEDQPLEMSFDSNFSLRLGIKRYLKRGTVCGSTGDVNSRGGNGEPTMRKNVALNW